MKIQYDVKNINRKALVAAISQELGMPANYLGAPTFSYEVGGYTIEKDGTVTGPDNRELVARLSANHGFTAEGEDYEDLRHYKAELGDDDCPDRMEIFSAEDDEDAIKQAHEYAADNVVLLELLEMDSDYNVIRSVDLTPKQDRLIIEVPLKGFTPEKLENLTKLVNAKATLLKTALGTDDLTINQTDETLQFPWFCGNIDAEHTKAYTTLVSLLCKTVLKKKRIMAKEKEIDGSPKYAMRCFLLSIGFIGKSEDYKISRKILLSGLEGNSSWKNGK